MNSSNPLKTQETICSQNNILLYTYEEIKENLQDVINRVATEITSPENSLEYARFALEKIMPHIEYDEFELKVFQIACPVLLEAFSTASDGIICLREGLSLTIPHSETESIYALLNPCSITLQALCSTCDAFAIFEKVDFKHVRSFINVIKDILSYAEPLALQFQGEVCGGIFIDDTLYMKKKFLQLLVQKVKFDTSNDRDIDDLLDILRTLAKSAFSRTSPQPEELIVIAETWKTLIYFLEQYDVTKTTFDGSPCIMYLSCSINEFLENQKPTTSELTLYNILLKILVKLCKLCLNLSDECRRSSIRLLFSLFRLTPAFMLASSYTQQAAENITSNLTIGANPLLNAFITQPEFPPILCKEVMPEITNNAYGCLLLLLSIVKKICQTKSIRKLYFNHKANILQLLFECFGECHSGILQSFYCAPGPTDKAGDLYEHIVTYVTAFTLCLTPDEFTLAEKTLWQNILQSNPWQSILASDIFCVVSRYATPSLCHSIVDSAVPVLQHIDALNSRPEFVNLISLLKRLLPLCEPEFVEQLYNRYPFHSCPWLHQHLGTHAGSMTGNTDLEVIVQKCLNSSFDIHGLLSMEALANSMYDPSNSNNSNILNLIPDLWNFNESSPICHRYLCATLRVSSGALKTMPVHSIFHILNKILSVLTDGDGSPLIMLSILYFIENTALVKLQSDLKNEEVFDVVSNIFKNILVTESQVVRMLAWKTFRLYAQISPHTKIIKNAATDGSNLHREFVSYLKKELPLHPDDYKEPFEDVHYCSIESQVKSNEYDVMTNKKIKLDDNTTHQSNYDLEELVCKFEESGALIQLNAHNFTPDYLRRLKTVCENINKIVVVDRCV